jgi:hypothetical protein
MLRRYNCKGETDETFMVDYHTADFNDYITTSGQGDHFPEKGCGRDRNIYTEQDSRSTPVGTLQDYAGRI